MDKIQYQILINVSLLSILQGNIMVLSGNKFASRTFLENQNDGVIENQIFSLTIIFRLLIK